MKRGLKTTHSAPRAIQAMIRLNTVGADLAERRLVRAGIDVTGFGLLGHLHALCRASGVGADLDAAQAPALHPEIWDLIAEDCVPGGSRDNLEYAEGFTQWRDVSAAQKIILSDAQTSGGLLLCVAPAKLEAVLALLRANRVLCRAVIGRIVRSKKPVIRVRS